MEIISGIAYNWRGLLLGLRTPKLLVLGFVRLAAVLGLTILAASLILAYHEQLMGMIWSRPQSAYILWLWVILSWLLSLLLISLSAVGAYLAAQILFSVLIMDMMARITERMVTGTVGNSEGLPLTAQFFFLIRQEVPRTVIPLVFTMFLMLLGWLTPLGPVIAVVTAMVTIVFLAWDNTDVIPARRCEPFGQRFRFLLGHLGFHLGFGLWFLVPLVNILFLSFAPVGAALYHIEKKPVTAG
ncbi:MAG: EI24 domain-containing protein [Thermodesulfobacteriota bacterium]